MLHRRYGNIQELRHALSTDASLAARHTQLASLLRTSLPLRGAQAAAPGGHWREGPGGGLLEDASGERSLLAGGGHAITDDHVQSALRLAMSSIEGGKDGDDADEQQQTDVTDSHSHDAKPSSASAWNDRDDTDARNAEQQLASSAPAAPDDAGSDSITGLMGASALDFMGACAAWRGCGRERGRGCVCGCGFCTR